MDRVRDGGLLILRHALGYAESGSGKETRNYYCTDPDDKECVKLVKEGKMARGKPIEFAGGLQYFFVTQAGRDFVRQANKTKKVLNRNQKTYQRYLEADCGMTFIEWLVSSKNRDRD